VAHSLLVIAYHILKNGVQYHELRADYFDRLNPMRLTHRMVKRLEASDSKSCLNHHQRSYFRRNNKVEKSEYREW
jgi:transposase